MQVIRNLGLAMAVLFVAGCASFTNDASPKLSRDAQWGIVPMVNYSQTPQAGSAASRFCSVCSANTAYALRFIRPALKASKR